MIKLLSSEWLRAKRTAVQGLTLYMPIIFHYVWLLISQLNLEVHKNLLLKDFLQYGLYSSFLLE